MGVCGKYEKPVDCSGNSGFFKRNAPGSRGRFPSRSCRSGKIRALFVLRSVSACLAHDLFIVSAVGGSAVPVFEFHFFRFRIRNGEKRRYFESDAFEGSVAAESSGGRVVRAVERFEVFVSERVDGESGHGESVHPNLPIRDRLTSRFLYFWKFRERCRVRDGYGIGRIVRLGDFVELENHFQSVLNLGFRSAAVAANALFYLERSELGEGDAAFGDFGDDGSTGLCHGDSRFDVGREEQGFYTADLRLVGIAKFADVAANLHQFFRQRDFRTGRNHSKIDNFRNRMPSFQHREANRSGSRIDTEDN